MPVEWHVKAKELVNCNCAYGCPCQFNALPTHGNCHAVASFDIEEGHFGAVRLDGLRAVVLLSWPGAIHEGNGTRQLIIDERSDQSQRDALATIMSGQEADEGTLWWIIDAMCPNKLEPLFKPIDVAIDVEARRGHIRVPGIVETNAEPIRNPVTGAEHRVRIDIPDGFEYRIAEMGSATTRATAAISLPGLQNSYAQLAHIHLSNKGVVD